MSVSDSSDEILISGYLSNSDAKRFKQFYSRMLRSNVLISSDHNLVNILDIRTMSYFIDISKKDFNESEYNAIKNKGINIISLQNNGATNISKMTEDNRLIFRSILK